MQCVTGTKPGDEEAIGLALKLCQEADATLLFLVRFGSELYGTSLPGKSDSDLRGLFLPSLASLAISNAKETISFSTGTDTKRNGAQDIDIDLWSVQKWLLKELPGGEIGAIDLLFAPSHKKCALFQSPLLAPVFAQPCRLLNLGDSSACCRYAISQARKYGIRGSRLGALKRAMAFVKNLNGQQRLAQALNGLIQTCSDPSHCRETETDEGLCLNIGGKLYPARIKIAEFRERLKNELKRHEDQVNRMDFKALSHAVRACDQMAELLLTGRIEFPLQSRAELIRIKTGQYSWPELELMILGRLEKVRQLAKTASNRWDRAFAENVILECYGLAGAEAGACS